MDHLERYRGTYEINKSRLERRRDIVISTAQLFVPDNFEEIMSLADTGDMELPLDWVVVPDPTGSNTETELKILPVLDMCKANKDSNEPGGLYSITLYGELPNGDERAIGSVYTREESGSSGIMLNEVGHIDWDSADAEIFLNLADSALQAQNYKE